MLEYFYKKTPQKDSAAVIKTMKRDKLVKVILIG
jgi:hypothetical protein